MQVMHRVEDVPAQGFPSKEVDKFTEVIKESAGEEKGKQYVKMPVSENRPLYQWPLFCANKRQLYLTRNYID